VVLSPRSYNEKTSLAVVCPVTSHAKGYPFEVPVLPGHPIKGVILSDHLKNLDWRQRQAEKTGKIPRLILEQVRGRIAALLEISWKAVGRAPWQQGMRSSRLTPHGTTF
jgi:mRNA interferase MazF